MYIFDWSRLPVLLVSVSKTTTVTGDQAATSQVMHPELSKAERQKRAVSTIFCHSSDWVSLQMVQRRFNGDRSIGMDDEDAADAFGVVDFREGAVK
jgi:hypothetical protein